MGLFLIGGKDTFVSGASLASIFAVPTPPPKCNNVLFYFLSCCVMLFLVSASIFWLLYLRSLFGLTAVRFDVLKKLILFSLV